MDSVRRIGGGSFVLHGPRPTAPVQIEWKMVAPLKQDVNYAVLPSVDEQRRPIFSVLLKRTYDIQPGSNALRAEQDQPLTPVDIYYDDGDPETSTVKYESDLAPYKLMTDIVVVGRVYAPQGQPAECVDAGIAVGSHRKLLRVFGTRRCEFRPGKTPVVTSPKPFASLTLRYERSFGGVDRTSIPDLPFYYPRNPLGCGLAVSNTRETIDGLRLPNIEDPHDLLTPERIVLGEVSRWNQQPLPQGFGWYQKTWYPRCSFAGSVPGGIPPDETMREEELGLVPKGHIALARQFRLPSYDVRFNNGASLGLAVPPLRGDETVTLKNLTASGLLEFKLPGETPTIMLDISLGENTLVPVLHTVCIRPEDMQVDLVWRGAQEYPGADWLPEMKRLRTEIV